MRHLKDVDIREFREKLHKTGGNVSKTAVALGVGRTRLYNHINTHQEWKEALADERGILVDDCLLSARLLAVGIPDIDQNGKFAGWIERPDGNMLRYILSTLGHHVVEPDSREAIEAEYEAIIKSLDEMPEEMLDELAARIDRLHNQKTGEGGNEE